MVFLQELLFVYIIFTDPTEKVTIKVVSQSSTIKEGDNITLKCSGNGNPPPQEFLFYIPVSPALLSLHSEIFCIIPSYWHCCVPVYTWFYSKWRNLMQLKLKIHISHYVRLSENTSAELAKYFERTSPLGAVGSSFLRFVRLHFPTSDISIRSSFDNRGLAPWIKSPRIKSSRLLS